MRFPIILKSPENEAAPTPRHGTLYYEVAENGVFQVRDTESYRAVTRASGPLLGLLPECEYVELKTPRLPRALLRDVLAFFNEVYCTYGCEAAAILYYRPETAEFHVEVPPQNAACDNRCRAAYSVRYAEPSRPAGFVRFGTIHSHADLYAYASNIDVDDEEHEDGLHVVFGDFGKRELSVSTSFVANRVRFPLAPEQVLETWVVPQRPAPRAWMARLHPKIETAVAAADTALESCWSAGTAPGGRQNRIVRSAENERQPRTYRR